MSFRITSIAALGLLMAACGQPAGDAAPAEEASRPPITTEPPSQPVTVAYACADGSSLTATYSGRDATVEYGGRTHAMTTEISASGARYVGDGLQWWTRGDEGTVTPMPEGGTDPAQGEGVICKTS